MSDISLQDVDVGAVVQGKLIKDLPIKLTFSKS